MTQTMLWFLAAAFALGVGSGLWYAGAAGRRWAVWVRATGRALGLFAAGWAALYAGTMAVGFLTSTTDRSAEAAGVPVVLVFAVIFAAVYGAVPAAAGAAIGLACRAVWRASGGESPQG